MPVWGSIEYATSMTISTSFYGRRNTGNAKSNFSEDLTILGEFQIFEMAEELQWERVGISTSGQPVSFRESVNFLKNSSWRMSNGGPEEIFIS
mmetsp:Transcript_9424/g.15246  ORF Transcript_9424/g.15246 Transcript_9424/m.15246 type:complete len:93 (+) Transcript_9424:276-554(+)